MREPFYRLTEESRLFLSRGYLVDGQEPEDRVRDIANHAEKLLGIKGFADKFYDYMSKGYYSLSSPVWSNYGLERGMPISCFSIEIQDFMGDIMHCAGELGMMSKLGGGVGLHFNKLRSRGTDITGNGTSSGSVHFMEMYDKITSSISQGGTRRGSSSPYLSIDHGDIMEFLEIGSEGNPIQGSNTGVVIPEGWMQEMIDGDKDKRKVWAKVLQSRAEKGFPYIFFADNVNNNKPQVYKDKLLPIVGSNICSEITLNTDENHSFVCCLSSINLVHRDEIEQTDAIKTMICFLDSVITEFLNKLESYRDSDKEEDKKTFHYMEKSYRFAKRERALGLGVLGRHHLLQSKMIPFESDEAKELNKRIFYTIKRESEICSAELAQMFGEPELLKGYGKRHSTLQAIAPTKSSSFILGNTSQSIEPCLSNYYIKDLAKTKVIVKNPYLVELLKEKKMNTREVRDSIMDYDGSVQHLDGLTHEEKDVFKTFREIDMQVVIDQAADRQVFIDQSQSLNIMVTQSMSVKDVNELIIDAWKKGIKTLYYQFSISAAQEASRKRKIECVGCSG